MSVLTKVSIERGQRLLLVVEGAAGPRWCHARAAAYDADLLWVGVWGGRHAGDGDRVMGDGGEVRLPSPVTHHPSPVTRVGLGWLAPGAKVTVHTWREMDARYTLRAVVVDVEDAPVGCVGLRVLDSRRVQNRHYFRVPLSLPPEAGTVLDAVGRERPLELRLRDLSASGISFRSSLRLARGEELCSQLRLPNLAEPLPYCARIVRVEEQPADADLARPEDDGYVCTAGAAFVDLATDVRESIIRHLLRAQRAHRQRGTLR